MSSAAEHSSAGTGHDDMTAAEQQAWHEAQKAKSSAARRRVRWHYRQRVLRHPLRWWRERCAHCGRRRFPDESMILMPGSGIFHDTCHGYLHWRRAAEELRRVEDWYA